MARAGYLLDVNTLFALTEEEHEHHKLVTKWFESCSPRRWGVCPFTEAGFLRVATNPKVGGHAMDEAVRTLANILAFPGFRFWPIPESWTVLTDPFSSRLFGHQQIADAYMLGLALRENGVLVTLDKALKYLAGVEHSQHVLVLE